MLEGHFEGKSLDDPGIRALFTRENLFASDWYSERLAAKQALDRELWRKNVRYLHRFLNKGTHADESARLGIKERLDRARARLAEVESDSYVAGLRGTIGAEPIGRYRAEAGDRE